MNENDEQQAYDFAQSEELAQIATAINAVYNEVGYVQKEGKVAFGATKYNYAGEASFIRAIRPIMVKHGVFIAPTSSKILSNDKITDGGKKPQFKVIISVNYKLIHTSGQFLVINALGEGIDSGDKGVPKALTGAYKYALRQAFMIETGDDPDDVGSEMYNYVEDLHDQINKVKTIKALNVLIGSEQTRESLKQISKLLPSDYREIQQSVAKKRKELEASDDGHGGALDRLRAKVTNEDIKTAVESIQSDAICKWIKDHLNKSERYSVLKIICDKVPAGDLNLTLDGIDCALNSAVYKEDIDYILCECKAVIDTLDDGYKTNIQEHAAKRAECLSMEV